MKTEHTNSFSREVKLCHELDQDPGEVLPSRARILQPNYSGRRVYHPSVGETESTLQLRGRDGTYTNG